MIIERLRKELGWSRTDMQRELEIPVRTLEKWEQGVRTPPIWAENLITKELIRRLQERKEENGTV